MVSLTARIKKLEKRFGPKHLLIQKMQERALAQDSMFGYVRSVWPTVAPEKRASVLRSNIANNAFTKKELIILSHLVDIPNEQKN